MSTEKVPARVICALEGFSADASHDYSSPFPVSSRSLMLFSLSAEAGRSRVRSCRSEVVGCSEKSSQVDGKPDVLGSGSRIVLIDSRVSSIEAASLRRILAIVVSCSTAVCLSICSGPARVGPSQGAALSMTIITRGSVRGRYSIIAKARAKASYRNCPLNWSLRSSGRRRRHGAVPRMLRAAGIILVYLAAGLRASLSIEWSPCLTIPSFLKYYNL